MEINFGFEIESVAGVEVKKEDQAMQDEEKGKQIEEEKKEEEKKEDEKKEDEKKNDDGEYSAMRQEERMKNKILQGVERIFIKDQLSEIFSG